MSPRRTHPAQEEWTRWLEAPASVDDPAELESHLEGCRTCRDLVETLRDVIADARCRDGRVLRNRSRRRR